MSTWNNWQGDLLKAASLQDTIDNYDFLTAWNNNANTNCRDNPIDLSHKETGSSNCQKLTTSRTAQNYASHATAGRAFNDQLNSGNFQALYALLLGKLGNTDADHRALVGDVARWGSSVYAGVLAAKYGVGTPGGGLHATGIHKGWADLQRSLGKHRLGVKVSATGSLDAATLRALRRARKVRIR